HASIIGPWHLEQLRNHHRVATTVQKIPEPVLLIADEDTIGSARRTGGNPPAYHGADSIIGDIISPGAIGTSHQLDFHVRRAKHAGEEGTKDLPEVRARDASEIGRGANKIIDRLLLQKWKGEVHPCRVVVPRER